jgi:LmbE family N-acetylglucosaminyl deacetylase
VEQTQPDEMPKNVAVVVAHPDDEILWAGGTILTRRAWRWFVAALCRGRDPDRAPKFHRVLKYLGASGGMADLEDGPEQSPLRLRDVQDVAVSLLPAQRFDLILTHAPQGEYTRHRRHEEVSRAVLALWAQGKVQAGSVWMFAYEDGGGKYPPRARTAAHRQEVLPEALWQEKRRLITEYYGFDEGSWEARAAGSVEAFWCFDSPEAALQWVRQEGAAR